VHGNKRRKFQSIRKKILNFISLKSISLLKRTGRKMHVQNPILRVPLVLLNRVAALRAPASRQPFTTLLVTGNFQLGHILQNRKVIIGLLLCAGRSVCSCCSGRIYQKKRSPMNCKFIVGSAGWENMVKSTVKMNAGRFFFGA
jgi:hypothetical protein